MIHPASWNYPDDAGVLDKTYMIGNSIIAADLSTSHSPDANANSSTVILPKSTTWFLFNSTQTVQGNGLPLERENDLKLNEFPVYVVEGSLIPVHPWDGVVQHSQAQRGLLEIQVYAGADATFALHEDDGFSNDYATSGNVRVTSLISHQKALMFAEWGQPYFTCDLTSPTATVLLRQYQGAVWW